MSSNKGRQVSPKAKVFTFFDITMARPEVGFWGLFAIVAFELCSA